MPDTEPGTAASPWGLGRDVQAMQVAQAAYMERLRVVERESRNHSERLDRVEAKMDVLLGNVALIKWLVVTIVMLVPAATGVLILLRPH